ncbi:homoserine O-acetyltransferase family protein Ecym_7466 [Eremothecium cymbalariae DBVPG|uniref:AB hydrolase-1 domain-containing protein n=1 Tax=Eremothecium cymbalariae (strain CBS 270.75 / DBVPG 7215 / KCTC 17166 / NRRL Y-17582) TaxID=931890 RepID=G8JWS0_ERECY|nr:hypothetical protein Ecym_7466 [Eremothecium cymbalariae DBVPG\
MFRRTVIIGKRCSSRKAVAKSSNPAMPFPCLDKLDIISARLRQDVSNSMNDKGLNSKLSRKELGDSKNNVFEYHNISTAYQIFHSEKPLFLDYGGMLPNSKIAFETWGELNGDKSNAILIHTGLSASSHARSSEFDPTPGWWENFIGPGSKIVDTNKFFVICTNVLGGCNGSTGPSSIDPADNKHYATRFPMLSIQDIVRAQNRLIREHFGIRKLFASIGSSMGGMQSLAYGQLFPEEVENIISISACAKSHPSSIAMRHAQRQVLMSDPNWNRGFYYPSAEHPDRIPPHVGMKLAREIATVTYRSGPEWEYRFGNERLDDTKPPTLCPDFLVETYLDHQGEKFSLEYDANSLLYLSKTMDLFDLSISHLRRSEVNRRAVFENMEHGYPLCHTTAYEPRKPKKFSRTTTPQESHEDLALGMEPLRNKNLLVIGVKSDTLFPYWQQRHIVDLLGNGPNVRHIELDESQSLYGHDTFLLDTKYIGAGIGNFLERLS